MKVRSILVLLSLLTGCAVTQPAELPVDQTFRTSTTEASLLEPGGDSGTDPVMYARDGSPITASGPSGAGNPTGNALGAHQPGGESGGRMYILELYQRVIEERDMLTHEISALNAELGQTRQTLAAADQRIAALTAQVATSEGDKRALIDENVDLAGRLTTAQIRRLQVEKILLEQNLAELRAAEQADAEAEAEAALTETQQP